MKKKKKKEEEEENRPAHSLLKLRFRFGFLLYFHGLGP